MTKTILITGATSGFGRAAAGKFAAGGWRVIEVWESEEEATRFFREHFVPALRAAGFDGPLPARELWPVHNALR